VAHRTLIVAQLDPAHTATVASAFAESDATALPHRIGVARRTLFQFHDLYFHLVEADSDIRTRLAAHRDHPLYQRLNTTLAEFVRPYDPNWRDPKDAMAAPFYSWSADR
jgi:cyclase